MNTTIANNIEIKNPTQQILDYCTTNLVMQNPHYNQNKALGFSTWGVNKQLYLYNYDLNSDTLELPFGLLRNIYPLIKAGEIDYKIKGVEAKKLLSHIVLTEYQKNAVETLLNAKNGVLVAPCGSGKTNIGLIVASELKTKVLWLTHTRELLKQSEQRARDIFVNIKDGDLGEITEGKVNVGEVMTFATVQTLSRIDLYKLQNTFGCIIVDECFSGDTEILTNKGFVRLDNLKQNELVAQYNDDGTITYVKPLRYIQKEANEYVSFKYKDIEIKTTKNHNMVFTQNDGKVKTRPAHEYLTNVLLEDKFITEAKINIDEEQKLTDYQRVCIMLQADGCLYHKGKYEDTYKLEFSKQRKIDKSIELLEKAKIPYKIYEHKRIFENPKWQPSTKITFKMPKQENKYKILTDFLEQPKNSNYARDILEEIMNWDAYVRLDGTTEYDSVVKENVDFVKLCAFLCGTKCSHILKIARKKENHNSIYRVCFDKKTNWHYNRFIKELIKEPLMTYCVEVPTHKIIVRKDNFIFVCGNCHRCCGTEQSATMFYDVVNKLTARYKFGLTATPKRQGGYEKTMFALLGDVAHKISDEEVAGRRIKARLKYINCSTEDNNCIYTLPTKEERANGKDRGRIDTTKLTTYLTTYAHRNDLIIHEIMHQHSLHKKQIVMSDRVKHCEELYERLKEYGTIKVALFVGKNKKDNTYIRKHYEEFDCIITTYAMSKEGLDMPKLDTLHLTTPKKDNQMIKQCVGRIERYSPNKDDALVIAYKDFNIRYCCRCCDNVRQALGIRKQGYDFSK